MWPEPAGELGALELGELLCDEVPPAEKSTQLKYIDNIHVLYNTNLTYSQGST